MFQDIISLESDTDWTPPIPTRRKLYVHIGMHKTGTTTIQKFCYDNRDKLLSHKIFYPDINVDKKYEYLGYQHYFLSVASAASPYLQESLMNGFDEEAKTYIREKSSVDIFESFKAKISENPHCDVMISSESFYAIDENSIKIFAGYFTDFDIVPIIVHRNFTDWLNSFYNTYIFFAKGTADLENVGYRPFDLCSCCENWSKIAHNGKTIAISFEESKAAKVNLAEHFFKEIGFDLPPDLFAKISVENASPNASIVILARELRKLGAQERTINLLSSEFLRAAKQSRHSFLDIDAIGKYDDQYAEEIKRLSASPFVSGVKDSHIPTHARVTDGITVVNNLAGALQSFIEQTVGQGRELAAAIALLDRERAAATAENDTLQQRALASEHELKMLKAVFKPTADGGLRRKISLVILRLILPYLNRLHA